jgi:hypothetical protein
MLSQFHIKVTSLQSSDLGDTASAKEASDLPMADLHLDKVPADDGSEEVPVKSKVSAKLFRDLAPARGAVYCLPSPIDDKACILLHDALKILFNQTLGWVNEDCEEVGQDYMEAEAL